MPFELVPADLNIDFLSRRRLCAVLSLLMIAAGIGAVIYRGGVPMGIDFRGGSCSSMKASTWTNPASDP